MAGVGLGGLLTVLFASMDMKALLAGPHHYLLYALAPAMKPRMLMTLGPDGAMLPVPVRVGQAVDVTAQARMLCCGLVCFAVLCSALLRRGVVM
jgi:26S proteasome regulatory subunit N1